MKPLQRRGEAKISVMAKFRKMNKISGKQAVLSVQYNKKEEIVLNSQLVPGLSASLTRTVEKRFLASEIGSGLVSVFSTAMMIAFMEEAAVAAVQPFLPEGFTTVGVHIDVSHKAATPLGAEISFSAILREISDRGKMLFEVLASDRKGIIGSGLHKRALVNWKDFEESALKKYASREGAR